MAKIKVGLATCYIDNYGACLQAYALQNSIIDLGYKCEIIDYVELNGYDKYNKVVNTFLRPTIYYYFRGVFNKEYLYYCKKHKKFNEFRDKLIFSKRKYRKTEDIMNHPPLYDAYVCGSDQIWNPTFYNGNNKVYHLDFAMKDKRRIAYAPSIGVSEFPLEYQEDFKKLLLKYSALSVREKKGAEIVKNISKKECRTVLDPTLLIPGDKWKKRLNIQTIREKYIFVYMFGERKYLGDFIEYARKKTGLKVICIPYTLREKQSDYELKNTAGPKEFVEFISNASLVITDSFHATAFSINLNVPFYSLYRNDENDKKGMNSRISSILELTGLQSRMIKSENDFPNEINLDVDFQLCNKFLEAKRQEDLKFLDQAIRGMQND